MDWLTITAYKREGSDRLRVHEAPEDRPGVGLTPSANTLCVGRQMDSHVTIEETYRAG